MLLIQNAHLIDPASRTDGIRDILIEGEKIIKIADHKIGRASCRERV